MLIVSDIDGTLLPYGATELDAGLFPLIARLRRQGVLFCPASGRQFHSLRQLFAPVAEELGFLCENGAIIYGPGAEEDAPVLSKITMPREDALALAEDMLRQVDRRIIISGANILYTVTGCGEDFLDMVRGRGNRVATLDDPRRVPEDARACRSIFRPWKRVFPPRRRTIWTAGLICTNTWCAMRRPPFFCARTAIPCWARASTTAICSLWTARWRPGTSGWSLPPWTAN